MTTVRVTARLPLLAIGQVWRHKRQRYRTVEITGFSHYYDDRDVHVRRNTSRRRQAMLERTLRRDYELAIVDARVARS